MSRTAWTKSIPASSFPSDRIKPKSANQNNKSKGTKTPPVAQPPKSRRVRFLENLIADLQQGKEQEDPKGGCFCQGRNHSLSPYIPLCPQCCLIRCSLNLPSHLCPSCAASPFEQRQSRADLITKLDAELASVLDAEQRQREQEAEERRRLMGAFPTLSQSSSASIMSGGYPQNPQQTHKVLSLNSKTKKATVTSYTPTPTSHSPSPSSSPAGSRPPSPGALKELEDEKKRVGKPLGVTGVPYARGSNNKWANLLLEGNEDIVYVPLPATREGKGRRQNKAKGKQREEASM